MLRLSPQRSETVVISQETDANLAKKVSEEVIKNADIIKSVGGVGGRIDDYHIKIKSE